ncbi:hypothetical protein F2Q70_00044192 [Brassica cretica]|uniref:RNase H type-1 domain-containing protein n=1 Tax=Brassica cretica TaxID=69181 RepID=A0A8S9KEL2_BRACR|nr:hypothetical protein F2Q70_00044192 [Brassica cretica]
MCGSGLMKLRVGGGGAEEDEFLEGEGGVVFFGVCPPAIQCWALSNIPSSLGLFPCSSLYVNVDTLLRYCKEPNHIGDISSIFPWIMWYQWKARNNKCFSNLDTTALDILQLARQEAEVWKMAQIVETTFTKEEENNQRRNPSPAPNLTHQWRCQVDASWVEASDGIGMGFVLFEQEVEVLRGRCKGPQTETPLHAEAESLCWAMKEVNNRGCRRINFESDCQQLVHIIQRKKQWPALEPVLDEIKAMNALFKDLSLMFISRSANVRADNLAKEARAREQCFSFYEVKDPIRLAIEASLYESL